MDESLKCTAAQLNGINEPPMSNGFKNDITNGHYVENCCTKRSVKFDEDDAGFVALAQSQPQRCASMSKKSSIPATIRPLADQRLRAPNSEYTKIKYLSICPHDELQLCQMNGESDPVDVVVLRNDGTRNVIYKIKITSPEKFRVRPSTGVIVPGGVELVRVYLQNEYSNSVAREKLLLMAVETDSVNNEDFTDAWKSGTEHAKLEHKLRCRIASNGDTRASVTNCALTTSDYQSAVSGESDQPTSANDSEAAFKRLCHTVAHRQTIIVIAMLLLVLVQFVTVIWQNHQFNALLSCVHEMHSIGAPPSSHTDRSIFDSEL